MGRIQWEEKAGGSWWIRCSTHAFMHQRLIVNSKEKKNERFNTGERNLSDRFTAVIFASCGECRIIRWGEEHCSMEKLEAILTGSLARETRRGNAPFNVPSRPRGNEPVPHLTCFIIYVSPRVSPDKGNTTLNILNQRLFKLCINLDDLSRHGRFQMKIIVEDDFSGVSPVSDQIA